MPLPQACHFIWWLQAPLTIEINTGRAGHFHIHRAPRGNTQEEALRKAAFTTRTGSWWGHRAPEGPLKPHSLPIQQKRRFWCPSMWLVPALFSLAVYRDRNHVVATMIKKDPPRKPKRSYSVYSEVSYIPKYFRTTVKTFRYTPILYGRNSFAIWINYLLWETATGFSYKKKKRNMRDYLLLFV